MGLFPLVRMAAEGRWSSSRGQAWWNRRDACQSSVDPIELYHLSGIILSGFFHQSHASRMGGGSGQHLRKSHFVSPRLQCSEGLLLLDSL